LDGTGEVYHAGFEASKKIALEIVNNATKGVALTARMALQAILSVRKTSKKEARLMT
jgi:hypothetical protein